MFLLDRSRAKIWIVLLDAVLIFSLGCRKENIGVKDVSPQIRIGYLPIAAELPLFVAIEQHYFEDAGLRNVKLVQFASSNELVNAASADKVDILAGAATNVVWDAGSVSGKQHRLFVLNPYSNEPGHVTDYLIAGNRSGITSVDALQGKRVGSFPGSVRVLVSLGLEKQNLPRTAYELIELLPKDWQPALQSGAIDAVVALEPNASQIIKDQVGHPIISGFYATLMSDLPLSGHWISADYLNRSDKEHLDAIVSSYRRAIVFCRSNELAAKRYLPKYANVREDILDRVNLNPWKEGSEIDSTALQSYADLLFRNRALRQKTNIAAYLLSRK